MAHASLAEEWTVATDFKTRNHSIDRDYALLMWSQNIFERHRSVVDTPDHCRGLGPYREGHRRSARRQDAVTSNVPKRSKFYFQRPKVVGLRCLLEQCFALRQVHHDDQGVRLR